MSFALRLIKQERARRAVAGPASEAEDHSAGEWRKPGAEADCVASAACSPALSLKLPPIDLTAYRVGASLVETVVYVPDAVTAEQEAALLGCVDAASGWRQLRGRRARMYGGLPGGGGDAGGGGAREELPAWLDSLCGALHECGAFPGTRPNHVLVNDYAPGDGILYHTDGPRYTPFVCIVSLGGPCVMRFRPRVPPDAVGTDADRAAFALVLRPRSLLVFSGAAYADMLHGIEEAHREELGALGAPCINLAEAGCSPDDVVHRAPRRVSMTVRHVDFGHEKG